MHQPTSPTAATPESSAASALPVGSFVRPFIGFTLSTILACLLLALAQM